MKRLIFILATFAFISSQGQSYMNTSINPLVDASYHISSSMQYSFRLPGGNVICSYGQYPNQLSFVAKINIYGDTLKVIPLIQNGFFITPIDDNLFYLYSYPTKTTAFDSNLNIVNRRAPSFNSYTTSLRYICKEYKFLNSKYANDTFTILRNNLFDYSTEDSFIIIRHELEDTGSNFAIYDYAKMKSNMGRILIGACDYIPKKKSPSQNYYIALIDNYGHTTWKHKVSASISLYGFPRLVSYTDSNVTFLVLATIDTTTMVSQLYVYSVNIKGDTTRKEMIKDSSHNYYYSYYTKNQTVIFVKDHKNIEANYLVIDQNGNIIKSVKRNGYSLRFPGSIFKDDSYGWIETGVAQDTSYNRNIGVGYIAHLDSSFCTYTKPDFDIGHVSGIFTVSLLSKSKDIYIDSISTYHWKIDNAKADSISSLSYTFKDTGMHTIALKITNKSGCESVLEKTKYINYPVGIIEAHDNRSLSVLNNPFASELTMIYTGAEKADLRLSDAEGRVVVNMQLPRAGSYSINTAALSQGVYYLYSSVNGQLYKPIKVLKVE